MIYSENLLQPNVIMEHLVDGLQFLCVDMEVFKIKFFMYGSHYHIILQYSLFPVSCPEFIVQNTIKGKRLHLAFTLYYIFYTMYPMHADETFMPPQRLISPNPSDYYSLHSVHSIVLCETTG